MRYEFKYIVNRNFLEPIREMIKPFVDLDHFSEAEGNNHYTVRSIYFDTPNFDYYFEKIEGIKNRKKIRLRGYNHGDYLSTVVLEIKRKFNIPIVKYRASLPFGEAVEMFKTTSINGFSLLNQGNGHFYENANRFFYQVYSKNLRPVVLVVYEREAFFSKFDESVRITLDKGLRGLAYPAVENLFKEDNLQSALSNEFIIEVKFNRKFPMWLAPILSRYGLKSKSASKYTITMDAVKTIKNINRSTIYTHSKWYN
jgi:hypothetical protein